MGTKNNPGEYDCYANAEPDEPMFVLLARDEKAPTIVEAWAELAASRGSKPEKVHEALHCAEAMRSWALVKRPDAPAGPPACSVLALKSAIRTITVDMPDDQPNGRTERLLAEISECLQPRTFPTAKDGIRIRVGALNGLFARLCEALADDTKRLREAAEGFFGGDFRAPPLDDDAPETLP